MATYVPRYGKQMRFMPDGYRLDRQKEAERKLRSDRLAARTPQQIINDQSDSIRRGRDFKKAFALAASKKVKPVAPQRSKASRKPHRPAFDFGSPI